MGNTNKNNNLLFTENICGWTSWGEIFQSIESFLPLIEYIFEKHSLEFTTVTHLTPGTNAVFRVGRYVIKIFAPEESGIGSNLDLENDFAVEISGIRHAENQGILTPHIICVGEIESKYKFLYLIMEFIDAKDVGEEILSRETKDKIKFAKGLKDITDKLNIQLRNLENSENEAININRNIEKIKKDIYTNHRWKDFSETFRKELFDTMENFNVNNSDCVYVHGDLNSDNILLDKNNNLYIIDFADSHIAPYYYEWVPIVFDLFKFDEIMMKTYFDEKTFSLRENFDELVHLLTLGIMIHDFGGDFLKNLCKEKNRDIETISSANDIKNILKEKLNYKKLGVYKI